MTKSRQNNGRNDNKTQLIDETDAKIVTLLQADGRLANTEIARRLGIAEGTVRKRVGRLLREEVIQVGAWADPLRIGYQTYAIIEVQVHLPDIERVAERLASFSEVFFLGICTGNFDIFAAAIFRSSAHLYEFVTKRLSRTPGIVRTSTSNVIRVVKRNYTFPALATWAGTDGARRPPRAGGARWAAARRGPKSNS